MNLEIELPDFVTPLMRKWLLQYKIDVIKDITTIGLFYWNYRPNRRKPEKPGRILRLGKSIKIKESDLKRGIYFLEVDSKTLHVFESSGLSLAGIRIAKEFIFEDEKFTQMRILLNYIS